MFARSRPGRHDRDPLHCDWSCFFRLRPTKGSRKRRGSRQPRERSLSCPAPFAAGLRWLRRSDARSAKGGAPDCELSKLPQSDQRSRLIAHILSMRDFKAAPRPKMMRASPCLISLSLSTSDSDRVNSAGSRSVPNLGRVPSAPKCSVFFQ